MSKIYVDSNSGLIVDDKISSLPITLITDVVTRKRIKSDLQYRVTDFEGNLCYINNEGHVTVNEYEYIDDILTFDSSVATVINNSVNNSINLPIAKRIKNKPYYENPIVEKNIIVDETNCIGMYADDILFEDAQNLLELSSFQKAIIDIMDCIVAGTYSNYCSYKVTLESSQHVIFNMNDVNIKEGILLYNIPEQSNVFINSIKIPKNIVDEYNGIYYELTSTDLNIKIENPTMNNMSVVNPIILFN